LSKNPKSWTIQRLGTIDECEVIGQCIISLGKSWAMFRNQWTKTKTELDNLKNEAMRALKKVEEGMKK
jgi:hypothetical protein